MRLPGTRAGKASASSSTPVVNLEMEDSILDRRSSTDEPSPSMASLLRLDEISNGDPAAAYSNDRGQGGSPTFAVLAAGERHGESIRSERR